MKENWSDKIAQKTARQLLRLQEGFASVLERKTSNWSPKKILILVMIFCLIWGGLSFLFIARAIFFQEANSISVDGIQLPQHTTQTGEPSNPTVDTITNKKNKE